MDLGSVFHFSLFYLREISILYIILFRVPRGRRCSGLMGCGILYDSRQHWPWCSLCSVSALAFVSSEVCCSVVCRLHRRSPHDCCVGNSKFKFRIWPAKEEDVALLTIYFVVTTCFS